MIWKAQVDFDTSTLDCRWLKLVSCCLRPKIIGASADSSYYGSIPMHVKPRRLPSYAVIGSVIYRCEKESGQTVHCEIMCLRLKIYLEPKVDCECWIRYGDLLSVDNQVTEQLF